MRNIIAQVLIFFYNFAGDYGLAIILLTLAVRLITLPLSMKQLASTRVMQKLAPEQKRLQEKYKDDKDKLNKELMELYREHNYNPLSGCLPLLIQFPILIAVFGVLRQPEIMSNAIPDFSPLFVGLIDLNQSFQGLLKEGSGFATYFLYALIPLLSGLTTYLQTKQTAAGQPQGSAGMGSMTLMMPLLIIIFSYSLPQGLPLYWLTGNIFSIAQHYLYNRPKPSTEGGM